MSLKLNFIVHGLLKNNSDASIKLSYVFMIGHNMQLVINQILGKGERCSLLITPHINFVDKH